jgi:hypothetical protein
MIVIDSEFQSLIPPLADDEYDSLEKSLVQNGYQDWREPIITWNGTIIDGHNRYHICDEHGIPFRQMEREFDSRDAAKIWIIENQSKLRRNLNPGQKATLEIDLHEAEVREQARLRQAQHGNTAPGRPKNTRAPESPSEAGDDKNPQHGRTAEILAKQAGVGPMTIKRALRVKKEDPELYDKVRSGEVSVTTAYKQVTNLTAPSESPKKAQYAEDGRRICSICGEPINEGDSYDGHQFVHKKCHNQQRSASMRKYRNPTIGDTSEVLAHDKAELRESLLLVVQDIGDTLLATINRYETMGVKLGKSEQERIIKSLDALTGAVKRIKE